MFLINEKEETENMKRKEFTKFLAMMMCVAMVTGSGVPVSAADLAADEIAVETQEEDEDYTEGDTEEVVADEEADPDTDVSGNAEDAADLFSDEETDVPDAGEETTAGLKLSATLNGGTAVDAVVTDEKVTGPEATKVNVKFSSKDVLTTGNKAELVPTVAEGESAIVCMAWQGMPIGNITPVDGKYTVNIGTKVDGNSCLVIVTHADKTYSFYRVYFNVEEEKQELQLTGALFNQEGTWNSNQKTAELTNDIYSYNGINYKKVKLTFDKTDGYSGDGLSWIKLNPVAEKGAEIVIGNTVGNNGISDLWTNTDGAYTWTKKTTYGNVGRGQGPAQGKATVYCQVTHKDTTVDYYRIDIIRKGYASVSANWGLSEESPANGIWAAAEWNAETGEFKSYTTINYLPMMGMGLQIYDEDGAPVNTSSAKLKVNPEYKGDNFWVDDTGYIHAKGAGASDDFLILECGGKDYKYYIKAVYNASACGGIGYKGLFSNKCKDGTTSLNVENFADADAFAVLFPEAYKKNAKTFYTLVTECQEAVKNNTWDSSLSGKFWDDNCESAKLNKIIAMSSDIWSNIYGIKDAKDTLTAAADLEHVTDESKKAELETALNEAIAKIDADYKDGKITSIADVNELVEAGKKDIYTINPISIADFDFTLSEKVFTYDGKAKTPEVTVKNGETVLKAGEDYDVEYKNNTKGGMATVTVTGKGIYTGFKELTFTIESPEQKPATPGTTVKDPNKTNTTISTNTAKTEYKVLNIAKTAFTKTEGNKAFKLGVKTKVKGTVAYKSSNKKVVTVDKKGKVKVKGPGRAVITVTGKAKGLKTETAKITITVKPSAKLSAKAAAQSGKKLKVMWKRNKKASGYQIVVATDKSFKNVVKTVNVKKNKTVKATVKGLKSGKKYYVRVRSMKKSSGVKVYGNWSKAKPVKAKK